MPTQDDDPEFVACPPGWERVGRMFRPVAPMKAGGELITEDVGYHTDPDVDRLLRELAAILPRLTPTERVDVFVAFETEWCATCGELQLPDALCQCWNDE